MEAVRNPFLGAQRALWNMVSKSYPNPAQAFLKKAGREGERG